MKIQNEKPFINLQNQSAKKINRMENSSHIDYLVQTFPHVETVW